MPDRRLAAILVADVVGYSRLMGADEVGTLRRFRGLVTQFVEPSVRDDPGLLASLEATLGSAL